MTKSEKANSLPRLLITAAGTALHCVGSLALVVYALILGPLGVLRGPFVLEMLWSFLLVLVPQRLVARTIRAAFDWRLGRFDAAIAQTEVIVGACEEYARKSPDASTRRRVLQDLYTLLARAYMHAGHIDDAMVTVIRARKNLGIDRLPGLAALDAKTAHLVRAGLAAGRLLDGNGLATMFVKSQQTEVPPKPSSAAPGAIQGASKSPQLPSKGLEGTDKAADEEDLPLSPPIGKVIPFPRMQGDL